MLFWRLTQDLIYAFWESDFGVAATAYILFSTSCLVWVFDALFYLIPLFWF